MEQAAESHVSEHLESVLGGRLRKALLLTGFILVVELAGGVLSGSLALLSDAGHVTTDVLALGLAWYAVEQTLNEALYSKPAPKGRKHNGLKTVCRIRFSDRCQSFYIGWPGV